MDFGLILLAGEERRRNISALKIMRRRLRDASNPFDLEEADFVTLFRINREVASQLISNLREDLRRQRSSGLPIHIMVLAAVRFYAVGSYQRAIGQEFNLALGQTTVSKAVRDVSRAVVQRLLSTYVKFPNTAAERQAVASGFEQKFQVPDVLGCIDCTHVSIVTPYANNPNNPPEAYRNRKGFYSINTQLICDVNCKILNVNARYPGSTHDAHIFNLSLIKDEMERLSNNRIGKYFLIGDSGYAKEAYFITPILPTPIEGTPEHLFNKKVSQIRNCVERTNGILKAVFRCLRKDRVLHYQPETAAMIILSCCTIYNMMHHFRSPMPDLDVNEEIEEMSSEIVSPPTVRSRQAALQRQRDLIDLITQS